ncbi:siderophore-iron reductase FhuF [Pseudoalteromonas aurantia]|uniref:Siderophore-iron reductase FhuF n=1 Tax=Pseudoalteromonas aurantia TaxID=43654 RepID=A0A5S3V6H8_9GAMM|nr:siderophore-iron reductase FhuF [Pseudoalteromonas aurantia]TMO66315.1 siderophore-iron reductase FhuF [Pseudoalteromonas aurantia]TMO76554.1 siderophore-iron reductase FhuF [Pseudoalteromonas aurantia]
MLPILSPYLSGPFANYGKGVGLHTGHTAFTLDEQMKNGMLRHEVSTFTLSKGVAKSRSQASVWHMHYTLQILPSIIIAHSVLQQPLTLSLKSVFWHTQLQQLQLPDQGLSLYGTSIETRYSDLIFNHLAPLHDWLEQHFSISNKVLWSNCTFRFNQFLHAIEHALGHSEHLANEKRMLLSERYINGQINPLYSKPIILTNSFGTYRIRNHCCLLHDVPNKSHCNDCPKLPKHIAHYSANRE